MISITADEIIDRRLSLHLHFFEIIQAIKLLCSYNYRLEMVQAWQISSYIQH
ncbi:hypothetical protein ILT44_21095 [Microvirga sp. BT689]|uniref:hypothetical protein n=1 Tax=Microvirga arvi TaxID=2778731 RepID=UPI0019503D38|nr:hypothetical protein [Microvirga arvi]MBM6582705.1 hypothetical protein [Microvirga arvi]